MSDQIIKCHADARCRCCNGRGTFVERHGGGSPEVLMCDCLSFVVPQGWTDDDVAKALDGGEFEIVCANGDE